MRKIHMKRKNMSFKHYMDSLKSPITKKQEMTASHDKLVECNMKFVVSMAHHYKYMHPIEDLVQAGNIGLMKAAERFKPNRNTKFITYARHYIKMMMMKVIMRDKLVKHSDTEVLYIDNTNSYSGDIHGDMCLRDMQSKTPYELMLKQESDMFIKSAFEILDRREMDIINNLYGLNGHDRCRLAIMAKKYGLSIQMISLIRRKAIKKMKERVAAL
jgi:RNA polymerase sigma factor (sigma-70 family)